MQPALLFNFVLLCRGVCRTGDKLSLWLLFQDSFCGCDLSVLMWPVCEMIDFVDWILFHLAKYYLAPTLFCTLTKHACLSINSVHDCGKAQNRMCFNNVRVLRERTEDLCYVLGGDCLYKLMCMEWGIRDARQTPFHPKKCAVMLLKSRLCYRGNVLVIFEIYIKKRITS